MKIAVIINSISQPRKRRAIIAALREKLDGHDLDVRLTEYRGHATLLARQAAESGVEVLIVAGGDGTIGEAVNCMIGSTVRLAVIPTGTANDLADYLGISGSITQACDVICRGRSRQIDVLQINRRHVLTTAGFGIGCETIAQANRLRRVQFGGVSLTQIVGNRLYPLGYAIAVVQKQGWPHELNVRQNGLSFNYSSLSLTISNLPRLGHRFIMAPGATADDGLFDVCVIGDCGRVGALRSVIRAHRGLTPDTPRVRQWRATDLVVESTRPISCFGDGELISTSTHFEIHVIPGAVTFMVPGETEVE